MMVDSNENMRCVPSILSDTEMAYVWRVQMLVAQRDIGTASPGKYSPIQRDPPMRRPAAADDLEARLQEGSTFSARHSVLVVYVVVGVSKIYENLFGFFHKSQVEKRKKTFA